MEFKAVLVIFGLAMSICVVQSFPRDNTVSRIEEVKGLHDESKSKDCSEQKTVEVNQIQDESKVKEDRFVDEFIRITTEKAESEISTDQIVETPTNTRKTAENEIHIPGRTRCQFEEATEDLVCQEHCLPRGYSYGLCVGFKCSCI